MCVYHVCKVQFAGRVIGFGCHTEVKVPNPHRKLIVDFSFLPEKQWRMKHVEKMQGIQTIIIIKKKNPVDCSEKLNVANLMMEFNLEAESKTHDCLLVQAAKKFWTF